LVKDVKTGKIAGQQDLVKNGVKVTKVLGPAAWQAMALATQQHYLAEIDAKLETLQTRVDEVLAMQHDERAGTSEYLIANADAAREALNTRGDLRRDERDELRADANRAKEHWLKLRETAKRKIDEYETGAASSAEVEHAFGVLVQGTRALTRMSEVLAGLPHDTAEELEQTLDRESHRLEPVLPTMQELSGRLVKASAKWDGDALVHFEHRSRGIAARGARKVLRKAPAKPKQNPVDSKFAWRCGLIASSAPPGPDALVLTTEADGSTTITVES